MATTATAQYAPAQVGNGRTAHKTDAEAFTPDTLCERTVSRVLAPAAAAKMKECVACNRIATERAAAPAEQAEETPAAEAEAPAAPVEEPAAPAADAEQTPEAEDAPAEELEQAPAADEEAPAEGQVEVTAYTAATEVLHANGQDNDTRILTLDADTVVDTVAKMRRMPRWNAAKERFTVNKVAVIVARDAQGERVWVRGEAAPIRVDFTGTPIQEDAPAETGAVDVAAVLAATRVLRRRKEVQRVIDNREAARAWSAPAAPPAVEDAPAPAPVAEEAPAPAAEETEAPAAAPEWRTLKGVKAPFLLYGEDTGEEFRPASDRKQCTGEPLTITRTWMAHGTRYAQDATGRETHLWGAATRYWVAPVA